MSSQTLAYLNKHIYITMTYEHIIIILMIMIMMMMITIIIISIRNIITHKQDVKCMTLVY